MLGFFFRHYDPYVQRYVIFDDGSTDGSCELLRTHAKVDLRPMPPPSDPLSRVASGLAVLESCWQESRGSADWVIVTDIDEHIYHSHDLAHYLRACKARGVTIIPSLAYEMVAEEFPHRDLLLCRTVTTGVRWGEMNKMNTFSPDDVVATNFAPGRHSGARAGRAALAALSASRTRAHLRTPCAGSLAPAPAGPREPMGISVLMDSRGALCALEQPARTGIGHFNCEHGATEH